MTEPAIAYVLSDDDAVRDSLDALLQASGIPVRTYDSPAILLQDLPTNGCLLIAVHAMNMDPLELPNEFRGRGLSLPVIILVHQTPAGGQSNNAIILQTPIGVAELVAAVKKVLSAD